MKKLLSLIVIACILAGLAFFQYWNKNNNEHTAVQASADFKPKVGYVTSANSLPDLQENLVSFGGGQTKLQLVNFWASWCGPCELEAPDLQKLHEEYDDVLTLYGVNSTKYDRERNAREFVDKYGFTFDVLMDREGDLTNLFLVNNYPTSFLIDTDGIIRERINGVITYEEWERLIEKWM